MSKGVVGANFKDQLNLEAQVASAQESFTQIIPDKIKNDPDKVKSVDAVFLFKVTGEGGGEWTVDLKDNVGVHSGEVGTPDCTIELSTEDWGEISENPSAAMQLYFQGKLKVGGNVMLATKLQSIIE